VNLDELRRDHRECEAELFDVGRERAEKLLAVLFSRGRLNEDLILHERVGIVIHGSSERGRPRRVWRGAQAVSFTSALWTDETNDVK